MAVQKLSRAERCEQTRGRNERRKELFASEAFKKGQITRQEIRKDLQSVG